MLSPLICI